MTADSLVRIPTRLLRKGLYVERLDRPWTDLPVLFQGLEIRTDDELAMLQRHCRHVYVLPERTERDEDLVLSETAAEPPSDIAPTLGGERIPDFSTFAANVRAAARQRSEAARFFKDALEEASLGKFVHTRAARPVVEALAREIAVNGSAAMWLTSLHHKDELNATHSVNVCVIALTLATYLGQPSEQIEEIGIGALLHDIGKVKLPRRILTKPDPLTDDERRMVDMHPWLGRKLVAETKDMTSWVRDIIWMHHEALDGSGYPRGLSGDQIPTHVRLVAIANAYESLTSGRAHRQALRPDRALNQLYADASRTYGEDMFRALIRCVGIYPVGSLVELDNGALSVVIGSSPDARLRPTVLLLRTPDGIYYQKRVVLNLAVDADDEGRFQPRHVRRVVDPSEYDIDVGEIVAFEFGAEKELAEEEL
ncbi:MAG: HD-GYP domain-containing protein [Halofilum sp. (in: g-proteobacteria)]